MNSANLDSEKSAESAAEFGRGKKKDAETETGGKRVGGVEETFAPTEEKSS